MLECSWAGAEGSYKLLVNRTESSGPSMSVRPSSHSVLTRRSSACASEAVQKRKNLLLR